MRKFHNRSLADCKFHAMSDTWPQRDKQGKGLKKKQPMKSTLSSKTQVPTLSIPPKLSRIFFSFAFKKLQKTGCQASKCSKGSPLPALRIQDGFTLKKKKKSKAWSLLKHMDHSWLKMTQNHSGHYKKYLSGTRTFTKKYICKKYSFPNQTSRRGYFF